MTTYSRLLFTMLLLIQKVSCENKQCITLIITKKESRFADMIEDLAA